MIAVYAMLDDDRRAELDREALEFVERWNTGEVDAELPVEYLLIVAETPQTAHVQGVGASPPQGRL